jgi:hypothetical protein
VHYLITGENWSQNFAPAPNSQKYPSSPRTMPYFGGQLSH